MGRFDHLIPAGGAGSNRFSHLIPQAAPQAMTEAPSLADLIGGTLAQPAASPLAPVSGLGLPELAQIDHGLAAMPPVAEPRLADPMQEAIRVSRRPEGPVAMEAAPALFNPTADTAMGDLLAGYLGLKQIPGAMQVAGGAKQMARAQDITRAMELAREMGFEMSPEDAAAAVDRETGLMERGSGMISEALPGIMDLGRQIEDIPINPAAAEAMQADTWGESIGALMEDPAGVARTMGLRSLAPSAPTAIAAILGSMGGPLGAAAGAGLTSGGTDYAMTIAQGIEPLIAEAGVDPNDARAVEIFMRSNPEAVAGMIEHAAQRGGIIGAFDAASGGVGGLLAKWAAAGGGARKLAATGGNIVADPTLGGAGEASAGGTPGDVLAEIVGGGAIGGPTELGQIAVEALKQPGQEMPSGQSAPDRSGTGAGPRLGEQQAPDLGALLDLFMQQQPQAPEPIAPPSEIAPPTIPTETPAPPALAVPPTEETPPVQEPPPVPALPVAPPEEMEAAPAQPEEIDQDAIAAQERQYEAPLPQKRPFTNMLRAAGIFIDPDTPGGKDLARVDVTSRTHPGLIKRGNGNDLDNIPASEHPEIAAIVGEDRGYLNRQGLIDAIRNETRGAAQEAVATARRQWEQMQAEARVAVAARPKLAAITIPDFVHPEQDIDTGPVRSENIRRAVNQAYNAGAPISPDERIRIIEHLDKNGGSVEYAIEREIIRSVLNAEAGEPVEVDQFPSAPLPGFDEGPVGAAVPGAVGTGRPELQRLRADGGQESTGQDRLAGEGRPAGDVDGSRPDRPVSGRAGGAEAEPSRSGEGEAVARASGRDDRERARGGTEEGGAIDLTPEGRQQVIPGAERITDKERAERAMAGKKRGGNRPMGDDSLFGDPGNRGDLFDEPKRTPTSELTDEERDERAAARAEAAAPRKAARRSKSEETFQQGQAAAKAGEPRPSPKELRARGITHINDFSEWLRGYDNPNMDFTGPDALDTAPAPADDEATPLTEAGVKEPGPSPSGSAPASPPKPLYVERRVVDASAIQAWAREQGFATTLPPAEMHVTVAYSKEPVAAPAQTGRMRVSLNAKPEALGDGGAIVLPITGESLEALKAEWQAYRDAGASWDFPGYKAHITLTYDKGDVDLANVEPFVGNLTLGPQRQSDLDEDAAAGAKESEVPTGASRSKPAPKINTTEEVGDTTGRKPRGRLSPKFLDFSFTERPSVYGAAFRAAGYEPGEAQSFPVEKQLRILKDVIKDTYGIEVTLPEIKVRSKNLVGRMVTKARPAIEPIKAVDQLLDAYRNLQMLASILGVPPKALALEIKGEPLTLSLTSRKRMGPLGMFSWGTDGRAIHLPGRSNSFAHEWGHALDHYLGAVSGAQIGEKLLSRAMDDQGVAPPLTPRRATVEAFAGVMRALYGDQAKLSALILELQRVASEIGKDGKPTKDALRAAGIMHDIRNGKRPPAGYLGRYFASSAEYDKLYAGGTGYFEDPAEMFARAFEAWVGNTVSSISDLPQGFMSKSGWAYQTDQDPRLAMTFPKGADALQFSVALTELSNAMSRSALFGADAPATRPEDVDIFSDKAMLMRLPKKGPVASARQELQESARSMRATLTGIGDAYRGVSDTASKVWFGYLTSLTATMHAVANRQEGKAAEQAFRNIADMMGNDPGAGRLIKHTYQQDMEVMAKRSLRKLDFALDAYSHGRQFTDEESKTLRSLLTGGKVQATPEMKELAGRLRAILKGIWYELQKAGIEVSYADEYLPRISNKEEIATDPMAFMKDGAKVYGIMFQKEVIENDDPETQIKDINAVVRGLRKARMPTPEGETVPASRLSADDEELLTNWREARRALSRLQNQAEKDPLNTKIGDKIVAAEAEVERLTELALDMLKERFSDYSAENWYTRMMVGDANDFDTMGPNASFLKGRTLPPEADAILTRWLQHDPIELIAGYTFSAARRAEYAKRFGAGGEKLENMLAAAVKDGATGHDVSLVRRAVNSAAGRFRHPDPGGEQLSAHLLFLGTLAMLGRATFASLGEPMAAGLRTGNVADSGRALTAAVGAMVRGGHRADLFELSKVIGLTTSAMRETVMANRLSADSAGLTKGMSLTMAKWFNRSLLTPLTNFQMASMMPAAHSVIMRHLRTYTKGGRGKTFANAELNELGIAAEEREDLLQWLDGLKGMPKPEDLLAPDGSFYNQAADLWATATVRLVNQIIQNPQKSDRPIMANHPMVAAVYGIMSFTMAFHRNILVRNVRRMARTEGISNKTLLAANVMASIGALFAGQFLATVVREALFNKDMWQEKEEEGDLYPWLLQRAFSRTGLTGAFDPIIQIARGIKYSRDIAAAAAGPHLGFFLQNAQTILSTVQGRNSPNTNTAEWNAARAFYQMAIQPAFMVATTKLPGGILSAPATSAIWWGSSPQASAAFADMMAGEKMKDGETYKKRGQATPWWELGD